MLKNYYILFMRYAGTEINNNLLHRRISRQKFRLFFIRGGNNLWGFLIQLTNLQVVVRSNNATFII